MNAYRIVACHLVMSCVHLLARSLHSPSERTCRGELPLASKTGRQCRSQCQCRCRCFRPAERQRHRPAARCRRCPRYPYRRPYLSTTTTLPRRAAPSPPHPLVQMQMRRRLLLLLLSRPHLSLSLPLPLPPLLLRDRYLRRCPCWAGEGSQPAPEAEAPPYPDPASPPASSPA